MEKTNYDVNDPRYLAEQLLAKFAAIHKDTAKQSATLCLKEMMKEASSEKRLDYEMARIHIKNKDV